jgi:KH domain
MTLSNMQIADYFEFEYKIDPDSGAPLPPPCSLAYLAWTTGAEVNYHQNRFNIYGNDHSMRLLLELIEHRKVNFCPQYQCHIAIKCELANELQEFVAGKKMGKLNKIMKINTCSITFEGPKPGDYNFTVMINSNSIDELVKGYRDLAEEFPAELYWYVPEEYHKRIIGVQGKTIQRIMKHYSVYVKFFNALEFAAAGGDAYTEDNVLARTPAKNALSLEECKKAVLEMVFQNVRPLLVEDD